MATQGRAVKRLEAVHAAEPILDEKAGDATKLILIVPCFGLSGF